MLVFNFKAAFLSHGSVEADLVVLIPGVAMNIADSRAVLPSGLALLNNLSLKTTQLKNIGAHISVICSGDPPAAQLLVYSVPGYGGCVSMLPPRALCTCRAV